ncbi:unnamed protein product, partial [Mesorhabditis belari]|uniref:Alpha-mannosidase n=1 Tax=Mesorhabditis belari TaxID=2138241 RepID=A0AAF3JBU2_9BILA
MRRLGLLAVCLALARCCSWDNCNPVSTDPNVLNVHLICHSHDDLGWLITVDQYYEREVQYIYDTVLQELEKDSTRRFSFAETGFFMRWVESRNSSILARWQKLVAAGQAEAIGGGWVQNDEATAHYVDIIDQMTLGYEHLKSLFGECGAPQAAWQIDPFGHSREFANLAAQMGMTSLWFARIHYLDRTQRRIQKNLEFNWVGNDEQKKSIFTGSFYSHYGPPDNFCFDSGCNDEEINDGNVDRRSRQFADEVKAQASHYRTNNVLLTMGNDFNYQQANKWYRNLDKLVAYINANPSFGMNVQYSTPACYANALQATPTIWGSKQDDFFPYASGDHSFWTGYFTSRPAFKGMIRQASSYLNLGKQLTAHFNLNDDAALETAKRASGLVQHHDGVSGTAKQVVTYDYQQRLDKGVRQLETMINDAVKKSSTGTPPTYTLCLLSNETVCDVSQKSGSYAVTVFNPIGRTVSSFVRVPFYHPIASVADDTGAAVKVQIVPTFSIPPLSSANIAPYELYIPVQLDPAGFRTYFVSGSGLSGRPPKQSNAELAYPEKVIQPSEADTVSIENDYVSLQFDANGYLSSVQNKKSGTRRNLKQEFLYYESSANSAQPSGAYIFRPAAQTTKTLSTSITTTVVKGVSVQETIRLYTGQPQIEFDWVIGPIPKENSNPIGKEIITRYTTDIKTNGLFWTDASGRQVLQRTWDSYPQFQYEDTEPIAGNYYPVVNRIFMKDNTNQLTVLTDRAQGGMARNGALELMLHRRCFHDDHFGVDEALDEPGKDGKGLVVRGQHWVLFDEPAPSASTHRPLAVNLFHRPIAAYATVADPAAYRQATKTKFAGLKRDLPANVNLLTLEKRSDGILMRLEHIFQANEDPSLSQPATIDFSNLFTGFTIQSVQELLLGGNKNSTGKSTTVTLNPQEIRTFSLTVSPMAPKDY